MARNVKVQVKSSHRSVLPKKRPATLLDCAISVKAHFMRSITRKKSVNRYSLPANTIASCSKSVVATDLAPYLTAVLAAAVILRHSRKPKSTPFAQWNASNHSFTWTTRTSSGNFAAKVTALRKALWLRFRVIPTVYFIAQLKRFTDWLKPFTKRDADQPLDMRRNWHHQFGTLQKPSTHGTATQAEHDMRSDRRRQIPVGAPMLCFNCQRAASFTVQVTMRDGDDIPSTPLCTSCCDAMLNGLRPLSNRSVITFIRTRLTLKRAVGYEHAIRE